MLKKVLALGCLLAGATAAHADTQQFLGTFAPEGGNGRTGSGTLYLEYDNDVKTLLISADWSGLSGFTSVAHIHCCTAAPNTGNAGVALATSGTLPGFPVGQQSGNYFALIDLTRTTSYGGGFLANAGGGTAAGAEAALIAGLVNGTAYFNIHTTPTFTGGEIRAFVTVVPEPGSWALMAVGVAAVGAAVRRRRVPA